VNKLAGGYGNRLEQKPPRFLKKKFSKFPAALAEEKKTAF
jgi:hypothetical protein